jgi:hypothetical protein
MSSPFYKGCQCQLPLRVERLLIFFIECILLRVFKLFYNVIVPSNPTHGVCNTHIDWLLSLHVSTIISVIIRWLQSIPLKNFEAASIIIKTKHRVWTTQSKVEDHSLVKLRQTSINLYQNVIILCHIRNLKRLPTANIELRPNKISPQNCLTHTLVHHFIIF